MHNRKDFSNIAATLKYGNIITKGRLVGVYIAIGLNSFTPLFTIFFIIISFLNADIAIAVIMIFASFVFLLLLGLMIIVPIRDKKLKEKILPWLDDAIELKAKSRTVSTNYNGIFQPRYYKIEISFVIEGKKYKRTSGEDKLGKTHHKIFRAYADREIKILYSQKHDEVLILKDKKN